jgi:hypothetical protein
MKQTISKFIGVGLIISALSGCPKADISEDKKLENIVIKVGESYSNTNLQGYPRIKYCGMNNEKTFSLSQNYNWAVNIFYPISIKEFEFSDILYKLEGVTPEEIELTYLGRTKKH